VSEVYQVSETSQPASEEGARTPHDAGGPASADHSSSYPDAATGDDFAGYSDADIDSILAAEEQLPEPRTRQEAAADTWDSSPDDPDGDELSADYDGDVAALLAAEQELPEPRTRQEAAADTWDGATQPGDADPGAFSGDPASEYDGDVAALIASEQRLPERRTRQEAAAGTWDDTKTSQGGGLDDSTDGTGPSQSAAGMEPPARNVEKDSTPDPYEHQVAVHSTDGTDAPVTVEHLPPEARTLGDTAPTGIGLKPTGTEIFDMESDDPGENSLDRLLKRANEDPDDLRDTISNTAETLHDLRLPGSGPSSGHAYEGHPVHESAPPAGPAFSDLTGSVVLVGVALLTGIRHVVRQRSKGDGR
jgi:hypothetical protein